MSMYEMFGTDPKLESQGILLDYGSCRVTIARAGGSNKRFQRVLEAKSKPYRRAIQTETLDPERGQEILQEVFAEAVVLDWETEVEGEWKRGIESPEGDLLPVTKENVIKTFQALPDLFKDIQEQSSKVSLFRRSIQQAEAGN